MEWYLLLALALTVLLVCFALRIPIALALLLSGFAGLTAAGGLELAESAARTILFSGSQNFLLVSVPLFILMAEILTATGASARSFGAVKVLFGKSRTAVPTATVGLGALLAAVSGSSAANVASLGRVALEELTKRGYPKSLAVGVVAASGGLGIVIPPSIPAILYGFVNGVSVLHVFQAAIVPGVTLAILTMALTAFWVLRADRRDLLRNPRGATSVPNVPSGTALAAERDPDEPSTRVGAALRLVPLLLLIALVLGFIYGGVATPTEAAAVGCVGALVIGFLVGRTTLAALRTALDRALKSTGFILLILVGAIYFVFFLNYEQIPNRIVEFTESLNLGPIPLLIAACLLMLVLGSLMETMSLVLVATPILAPVLIASGFDPLVVAIMMLLLIEMGLNTPPVGLNIFIMLGFAREHDFSYYDVVRGCAVYLLPNAIVIGLLAAFPGLALSAVS